MVTRSRLPLRRMLSMIAAFGLLATPAGFAMGWAANSQRQGMNPPRQVHATEQQGSMRAQAAPPVLLDRSPSTLDEYAAYVQNRLQVEAMRLRQQGTAELRLTIDKDGSIRQTEVVGVESSSRLRDQVQPLVQQIEPLPPPPGDADALVINTTLAFDYPGGTLMDPFGRGPRSSS